VGEALGVRIVAGSTGAAFLAGAAAIAESARQSRAQSALGSVNVFLIVCFMHKLVGEADPISSPTVYLLTRFFQPRLAVTLVAGSLRPLVAARHDVVCGTGILDTEAGNALSVPPRACNFPS
jgi:hypothetical protein